jgi:hypothetical protein
MAEASKNTLTLRPSTYRRPWHDYKDQSELNAERLRKKRLNVKGHDPLLNVVNEKAHKRIAAIRNSRNYQEAYTQNAQSALKLPKLKGMQIGRFSVSSTPSIQNSALVASTSSATSSAASPSSVKPLINGKHGRFIVSNEEPAAASASAAASMPAQHTKPKRVFEVSNSPEGGRRTRFHSRRNISRRRRHVGRRRTHRNGA